MKKTTITQIILVVLILIVGAYFHHPVDYDNSSTRYFQVSSVVDYGVLNIDNYLQYTNDTSYHDGHYYPNKAPGAQLIGIPVYWLIRKVKSDPSVPPLTPFDKYIIRLVTTTLPFALLGMILFKMGISWGLSPRKSLWMVLAYSFGSIAFQHATIFGGHQIAASFSFFSFFMLYLLSRRDSEETHYKDTLIAFSAGLLAGLAALSDYTAMFIALVLCFYALSIDISKRDKAFFLLGGCICLAILVAYNIKSFGSPFTLSYGHQITEEFKEGSESGFFGVSLPSLTALFSILFSTSRGLFFIMPVFLFSIFGFINLYKNADLRKEKFVLLIIIVGYLLINSGFYGWHGGWIFGPRYLVPMLPFLALPIVFAPWDAKAFIPLLCVSIFQVGISVIGFPHTPEEIKNPIMEIIIPCMNHGYFSKNFGNLIGLQGWWAVVPVIIPISVCVTLLFFQTKPTSTAKESAFLPTIISILWCLIIIVMLIFKTTAPERIVHKNRAMLLRHAALATKSRELYYKALYEKKLSELGF